MAEVLCTGSDHLLLHTRSLILEQGGHRVTSASSEDEVREACARRHFDVAVIGQSLVPQEKQRVFALVRELCPKAKVLELFAPYNGRTLADADDWLEVPAQVPRDLLERVTALSAEGAKGKSDKRRS